MRCDVSLLLTCSGECNGLQVLRKGGRRWSCPASSARAESALRLAKAGAAAGRNGGASESAAEGRRERASAARGGCR